MFKCSPHIQLSAITSLKLITDNKVENNDAQLKSFPKDLLETPVHKISTAALQTAA